MVAVKPAQRGAVGTVAAGRVADVASFRVTPVEKLSSAEVSARWYHKQRG